MERRRVMQREEEDQEDREGQVAVRGRGRLRVGRLQQMI
jgi:hypothetical protein